MSAAGPLPLWSSETGFKPDAGPMDFVTLFVFLALGLVFLFFPRLIVGFQIRSIERQRSRRGGKPRGWDFGFQERLLRSLQEKPPHLFYRLFGAGFVLFGAFGFIGLLWAAR